MIQYQRHKEILAHLEANQAVSIHRLAADLFTSESTIRRDLSDLEAQGLVRRVYGGAVLASRTGIDMPAFHREQDQHLAKMAIAERAAALIEDGMSIYLDAATTTVRILPHIAAHQDLTVITNSLWLTDKLGELGDGCVRVLCTGGSYIARNHAFGGAAARRFIETTHADLMLFSSRGITLEGEITDTSEAESEVRRAMLKRAEKRIFLCAADKIGRQFVFRLCGRGEYDGIISNAPLPDELAEFGV